MSDPRADMEGLYRETWASCDHIARSDAWSELYRRRFRRLGPGKDVPAAAGPTVDPADLRAHYDTWHTSGLAALDAILRVVELEDALEQATVAAGGLATALAGTRRCLDDADALIRRMRPTDCHECDVALPLDADGYCVMCGAYCGDSREDP